MSNSTLVRLIRLLVTEELNARVPNQLTSPEDAEKVRIKGRGDAERNVAHGKDENEEEVDVNEYSGAGAIAGAMANPSVGTPRRRKNPNWGN